MTTFEKYQIILELYRGGMGFSRIFKQTGFSKSTIVRCLKNYEPNRASLREANILAQQQRYEAATRATQEAKALEAQRKALLRVLGKRIALSTLEERRREYARSYYAENKERMLQSQKRYYEANSDRIRQYWASRPKSVRLDRNARSRQWRVLNPERNSECTRRWAEANPDWHASYRRREDVKMRMSEYRKTPHVRAIANVRRRLRDVLRGKRSASTNLGCSLGFFRAYIEARFTDGMTWDNYGTYWHIDHIRPIASFDLSKAKDLREVNHYTNLQPMEACANMAKGARIPEQLSIAV